jgi:hypothetical protein
MEGGNIPGRVHHDLLDLPLAHHRPAEAGDRGVRDLERSSRGLQTDHQLPWSKAPFTRAAPNSVVGIDAVGLCSRGEPALWGRRLL